MKPFKINAKDITPFTITTPINSDDHKLFTGIINQGIDSHLEAFTKSKFEVKTIKKGSFFEDTRLVLDFDRSELPILLRRLNEEGTENATNWALDIETALDNEFINEATNKVKVLKL